MSGVEVAGLLLGALPLLISALEAYNEGLDPIKAFKNWGRELPHFIRKLRNQHLHYEQTLRILLTPITTDDELAEMLASSSSDLWHTVQLKDKLGDSYNAYQSTIRDIERILDKIASKLDLEKASSVTRNDLEALLLANPRKADQKFEFKKRIKFSLSKKRVKAYLDELDECIKELERFTEKNEKLEPYRQASKPSLAKHLQRIQGYARNLHHVLVETWACSCRASHSANLQLEQRIVGPKTGPKTRGKMRQKDATCFRISFLSSSSPWTWQEAEVRIMEQEETEFAPKTNRSARVAFMTPPPTPPSTVETHEIKDICAAIRDFNQTSTCIGFKLDRGGKLRGCFPVDEYTRQDAGASAMISLDDLLQQPPTVNGKPCRLTKKERYILAVTLASSILQLHKTPWLEDYWSKRDILFPRSPSNLRPADITHPCVKQKYMSSPVEKMESRPPTFQNKNVPLLALGVLLLELYFGRPYEAQQKQQQAPSSDLGVSFNALTVWAMAFRWAENEKDEMSAAFLAAVTHCLKSFGDPSSSLQDIEFLQAAVEQIVLPLQDELSQFLGTSSI